MGLASHAEPGKLFRQKMEALCFGFFVPFFFVVSGVNLDLAVPAAKPEIGPPGAALPAALSGGAWGPVFLYGRLA